MRTLTVGCIVVACIAGAALAQEAARDLVPAEPFEGEFEERATGRDFAARYPQEALRRNMDGLAVVCCRPGADRYLQCVAAFEWPQGQDFGDASVDIARKYKLTEASFNAFYASPHNWLRRTIVWRLSGNHSHEVERVRRMVTEEGVGICRPDPVYPDGLVEPPAEEE